MSLLIQARDNNLLQFVFTSRVATYKQIENKFFAGRHPSAARSRFQKLCDEGHLNSGSIVLNNRLNRWAMTTEKSWDVIKNSYPFEIDRPHFKSESIEHDIGMVRIAERLRKLEMFDSLMTENLLQSSSYLAEHHLYRDLAAIQSDGALSVKGNAGAKYLYGIEYEISKKTLDRYKQKLQAYYRANGIYGVIYICGTKEIAGLIARADQEVCSDDKSIVYFALESIVLGKSDQLIFEGVKTQRIGFR